MSLTLYHVPAGLLAVAAVAVLFLTGGQAWDAATQPQQYRYGVSQIDETDVPEDERLRRVENLSASARSLFERARGRSTYVTTERAPDLRYNDDDVLMDGYNYVVHDGDYYRLVASETAGDPHTLRAVLIGGGGVVAALVLGGVGVYGLAGDRVKLPSALLAALVGLAGAVWLRPVGAAAGALALAVLVWVALWGVERATGTPLTERART